VFKRAVEGSVGEPALTAATSDGLRFNAATATDQRRACQTQRLARQQLAADSAVRFVLTQAGGSINKFTGAAGVGRSLWDARHRRCEW